MIVLSSFKFAMTLLDDPLVLVDVKDAFRRKAAGDVRGQGVDAIAASGSGDGVLVALLRQRGFALTHPGADPEEAADGMDQDRGDLGVHLFLGLVVAAA